MRHAWHGSRCPRCDAERRRAGRYNWRYSVDGRTWTHLSPTCGKREPGPKLDRAAERLVFALYIYPGYSVTSRGPAGCIVDALEAIAPDVAAELRDGDASEVWRRRWGEDDEEGATP